MGLWWALTLIALGAALAMATNAPTFPPNTQTVIVDGTNTGIPTVTTGSPPPSTVTTGSPPPSTTGMLTRTPQPTIPSTSSTPTPSPSPTPTLTGQPTTSTAAPTTTSAPPTTTAPSSTSTSSSTSTPTPSPTPTPPSSSSTGTTTTTSTTSSTSTTSTTSTSTTSTISTTGSATTSSPPTPPPGTTQPPVPPCVIKEFVHAKVRAKYFLAGQDSKVRFCASVEDPLKCKRVDFYAVVKGKRYYAGEAYRPEGRGSVYCKEMSTADGNGTPNYKFEAVGTNVRDTQGVPVALDIPQFVPPKWFVDMFGGSLGPFGTGDDWGYRRNVEVFKPVKQEINLKVPVVGGKAQFGANLEYTFKVDGAKGGEAEMEGKGGVQVNIEPPGKGAPAAGKVVAVAAGSFGVNGIAGNLYVPEFEGCSVGIEGEVALPTPLNYPFMLETPFGDYGAKIYVQFVIKAGLKIKFTFKEDNRPLPLEYKNLEGQIGIGGAVTGEVKALLDAGVTGKIVFSPVATWGAEGLQFSGLRIEAVVDITMKIFGSELVLHPVNIDALCTVSPPGCSFNRKRHGALLLPRQGTWSRIAASFSPTTQQRDASALVVTNVFPTTAMAMATSSGNVDVVVMTSLNSSISQIMYAVRNGGAWSDLGTVASSALALDMPTIACIAPSRFLLVAASVNDPVQLSSGQLMQATFDAGSGAWTAYAPLLPDGAASGAFDVMPVIARNGKIVAFTRNPMSATPQLMTSAANAQGSFGAPVLVAQTTPRLYSLDANAAGALLAFSDVNNAISVCTMPAGASAWKCKKTSRVADGFLRVAASTSGNTFVLVWNNQQDLKVDTLDANGGTKHSSSVEVMDSAVTRLTVTPSNRGDNSYVIGWDSCDGNGVCTFRYALVCAQGDVFVAPSALPLTALGGGLPWTSLASVLTSNGAKLVRAATATAGTDSTAQGGLTVTDLPYTAGFNVSDVTFSPADFRGSSVTISARISNLGLLPLNADGTSAVTFSFGGSVFAQKSFSKLNPGDSTTLSVKWNFRSQLPAGGKIVIAYTGKDDIAPMTFTIDPCTYSIADNVTISAIGGQPTLLATLIATGMCSTPVTVTVASRDPSDLDSLWAPLANTTATVKPFSATLVSVPVSVAAMRGNSMQIAVYGSNQWTSLTTLVNTDAYDFSLSAADFTVTSGTPGAVSVSFTASNAGLSGASGVPIVALLLFPDNSTRTLASTTLDIGAGEANRTVTMTLPLTAALNNVQFLVNNPSQPVLPESFLADNSFNVGIEVSGGTADGSWVTPAGMYVPKSPHKGLSKGGLIAVVVVCVIVGLALVAGVAYFLVNRSSNRHPNDDIQYSKIDQ